MVGAIDSPADCFKAGSADGMDTDGPTAISAPLRSETLDDPLVDVTDGSETSNKRLSAACSLDMKKAIAAAIAIQPRAITAYFRIGFISASFTHLNQL